MSARCSNVMLDNVPKPNSQLGLMVHNRLTVQSRVKSLGKHHFYAYVKPNSITEVGHLDLAFSPEGRDALISNFVVSKGYRKFGVGKKLLTAAIDQSKVPVIFLYANAVDNGADNGLPQTKLEAYYQSFGFKKTGKLSRQHGVQMLLKR